MGNWCSLSSLNTVLQIVQDIQAELTLLKSMLGQVQSSQALTTSQVNSVHAAVNNIHSTFGSIALAGGVAKLVGPTPSSFAASVPSTSSSS